MPASDPTHWLLRLQPDEWLAAAETELAHATQALGRRSYRPAVTHARRAAGMALNAILVLEPHDLWGRSYMEHVVALTDDEGAPDEVRAAARDLKETRPVAPTLVQLGTPDPHAVVSARRIADWARDRVAALQSRAFS